MDVRLNIFDLYSKDLYSKDLYSKETRAGMFYVNLTTIPTATLKIKNKTLNHIRGKDIICHN